MSKSNAIGVYDSGIGGLTVASEIFTQLPGEKIIYFGDTAHVPYGDKTVKELVGFADNIISFLIEQGAKIIVSACNTTSSVALDKLTGKYTVPIVGVINPGSRAAVKVTGNKKVGVIATQATTNSEAYIRTIKALDPSIEVYGQACPMFVPFVEKGQLDTPETMEAAEFYLQPLVEAGVDTVVFGCTHYPYLRPIIEDIMGTNVHLVDPAAETVLEAKSILHKKGLLADENNNPQHQFFCSGPPDSFLAVGRRFLNGQIGDIKQVNLD